MVVNHGCGSPSSLFGPPPPAPEAPAVTTRRLGTPSILLVGLLTASAFSAADAATPSVHGKVVAVLDGDTITVLDSGRRQHRIRLYQIDAPEKAQDFGAASKKSLSTLIYRREVTVASVAIDRYQREIGTVYLAGTDINLEQVRRGMAWVYRQYVKDPNYLATEQAARSARVGLWSRANAVPPWEYRRNHDDSNLWRWLQRLR